MSGGVASYGGSGGGEGNIKEPAATEQEKHKIFVFFQRSH